MMVVGVLSFVSPSEELAARVTHCTVIRRWYHTFVFLTALLFSETIGPRALEFYSCAVTLLSTPVSPEWSCGTAGGGSGERGAILWDAHPQNHYIARLSACIDRGAAATLVVFAAADWSKSKISSQTAVTASISLLVATYSLLLFPTALKFSLPDLSTSLSNSFNVSV